MAFRHGPFLIDLPEGWADCSQLVFTAPAPASSLPTAAAVHEPSESIRIEFMPNPFEGAQGFLVGHLEALDEVDPSLLTVIDRGPFEHKLGDAWFAECRLSVDGYPLRQLMVAVSFGPIALLSIASAAEERFEAKRQELFDILASLRGAE